MKKISEIKISKKLKLVLMITLVIFSSVTLMSYLVLRNTQANLSEALQERTKNLDLIRASNIDLYQIVSAEKDLYFMNPKFEDFKNQLIYIDYNYGQLKDRVAEYEKNIAKDNNLEEQEALEDFWIKLESFMTYKEELHKYLKSEDNKDKAMDIIINKRAESFVKLEDSIDEIGERYVRIGIEIGEKQNILSKYIRGVILCISAIGLLIICIIMNITSKNITNGVKKIDEVLKKATTGDLESRIEVVGEDELANVGSSINIMIESMENIIKDIKNTSVKLNASAEELESSTKDSLKSSSEIIASMDAMVETLEEQTSGVYSSSESLENLANHVEDITSASVNISNETIKAKELTGTGIESMNELIEISNESNKSVKTIDEIIKVIVQSSKEINEITYSINSIADRTNLLSLNASIEAAMAGDHGRGFSVVAKEIGELADQSKILSDRAKSKVVDMQKKVENAVSSIEILTKNFITLEKSVESNQFVFTNISTGINSIKDATDEVKNTGLEINNKKDNVIIKMNELKKHIKESNQLIDKTYTLASKQISIAEMVNNKSNELNKLTIVLDKSIE